MVLKNFPSWLIVHLLVVRCGATGSFLRLAKGNDPRRIMRNGDIYHPSQRQQSTEQSLTEVDSARGIQKFPVRMEGVSASKTLDTSGWWVSKHVHGRLSARQKIATSDGFAVRPGKRWDPHPRQFSGAPDTHVVTVPSSFKDDFSFRGRQQVICDEYLWSVQGQDPNSALQQCHDTYMCRFALIDPNLGLMKLCKEVSSAPQAPAMDVYEQTYCSTPPYKLHLVEQYLSSSCLAATRHAHLQVSNTAFQMRSLFSFSSEMSDLPGSLGAHKKKQQVVVFQEMAFVRAACIHGDLGFLKLSTWNDAILACQLDEECQVVTRRRVTGETYFCTIGRWNDLDVGWDTAVAKRLLGVLSEAVESGRRSVFTPLCQQCTLGYQPAITVSGCVCTECRRGSCPQLQKVITGASLASIRLPSVPISLPLVPESGKNNSKLKFFNPSLVFWHGSSIVAIRVSDDSKCKGLSVGGNFFPDHAPLTGDFGHPSSRIMLCVFDSLRLQEDPKACKILQLSFSDVSNSRGFNSSQAAGGGFEDPRLFRVHQTLYMVVNVGVSGIVNGRRMVLCRLDENLDVEAATFLSRSWNESTAPAVEKNWGPLVQANDILMVYSLCPFIICRVHFSSGECRLELLRPCAHPLHLSNLAGYRGSTKWVKLPLGLIGVVHSSFQGVFGRIYAHRLVLLAPEAPFEVLKVWNPFTLPSPASDIRNTFQYVTGLEFVDEKIYLLYGIADCVSAWMEIPLGSLLQPQSHPIDKGFPILWWNAECKQLNSPFCAGAKQLPHLRHSLRHHAEVEMLHVFYGDRRKALKDVKEEHFLSGIASGFEEGDVMVQHGTYSGNNIIGPTIVRAYGWPYSFVPSYMIKSAKEATEVWVDSQEEASVFVRHGVQRQKLKHIPLSFLGNPGCEVSANDSYTDLRVTYPTISEEWRLTLLFIGQVDEIYGLELLLHAYCRTFSKMDRTLLILVLTHGPQESMLECNAFQPEPTLKRKHFGSPATLTVTADFSKSSSLSWMKVADVVVFPSRVFSYDPLMLQALSCGKLLVVLRSRRARSYLPAGSAFFVPSHSVRKR
mmetsp:Transcript_8322/g.51870  ORF Transcript_8322/g.51870 Transcript_8322/m.51870 type:complete len:1062 (+) Transcript_8322:269-3454(+)